MSETGVRGRVRWAALNAYGVFIAVLVLLLSARYVTVGDHTRMEAHMLHLVGHIGYGLAGVGMLAAFWRLRVDWEVYAAVLLLASNLTILAADIWFGVAPDAIFRVTVAAALGLSVVLRITAVLAGGTFSMPPWSRHD